MGFMNVLNAMLSKVAHALLAPFVDAPVWGLVFWAALAGVGMTYVFGKTSRQAALKRAADQTRAQLLAIKLFRDDIGVTFRCQKALMKATAMRLLHSLPPVAVLLVPFVLVAFQLGLWYEHAPLVPGETTVVAIEFAPEAWLRHTDVEVDAPESVVVETGPLGDASESTIYWRLRPVAPGPTTLRWRLGDEVVEKELAVAAHAASLHPVSVNRPGPSFFSRLIHPGEPAFSSDSAVRSISVRHERRSNPILGLNLHWFMTFLIVSMLTAFLVRNVFGVQF